jgi:ABC-type sugar transport system ATPase subunit
MFCLRLYNNILIAETALRKLPIMLSVGKEREKAEQIMKELNIIAAGAGVPASSLSGGNQQKLIDGRWLYRKPKVLLLDDPTKGVDVNSCNEINILLKNMTKTGMSILYSSSDNEELLRVAERIYVFYEGKIIKELKGKDKISELLAATMLGVDKEANDAKNLVDFNFNSYLIIAVEI